MDLARPSTNISEYNLRIWFNSIFVEDVLTRLERDLDDDDLLQSFIRSQVLEEGQTLNDLRDKLTPDMSSVCEYAKTKLLQRQENVQSEGDNASDKTCNDGALCLQSRPERLEAVIVLVVYVSDPILTNPMSLSYPAIALALGLPSHFMFFWNLGFDFFDTDVEILKAAIKGEDVSNPFVLTEFKNFVTAMVATENLAYLGMIVEVFGTSVSDPLVDLDKGPSGDALLMIAAQGGYEESLEYFIKHATKHHASLDAQNHEGMTALHLAAKNGHTGCARLLVEAGASIYIKNNVNKCPRQLELERHSTHRRGPLYLNTRACILLFIAVNSVDIPALRQAFYGGGSGEKHVDRCVLKCTDLHLRLGRSNPGALSDAKFSRLFAGKAKNSDSAESRMLQQQILVGHHGHDQAHVVVNPLSDSSLGGAKIV